MYFCCKKCTTCCYLKFQAATNCCFSICFCFGKSCHNIFKCFGKCCDSILKGCGITFINIKKICETPFSCCTFFSFFITIIPFVLAIVGITKRNAFINCDDPPIAIHLIIEGTCNLGNFIFCLYLVSRYGAKYKINGQKNDVDGNVDRTETNILERTKNLILYDSWVCFYMIFIFISLLWTVIGFYWFKKVEESSSCYKNNEFTVKMDLLNIVVMAIFIIAGFFLFCFILLFSACKEGSCQPYDFCRCCLLVTTCGFCDIAKRAKKNRSENEKQDPKWSQMLEQEFHMWVEEK